MKFDDTRRALVYEQAIDTFGEDAQERKAFEELGELVTALARMPDCLSAECVHYRAELIDELADATIMLEQLRLIYDCNDEVAKRIDYKIARLLDKIADFRAEMPETECPDSGCGGCADGCCEIQGVYDDG